MIILFKDIRTTNRINTNNGDLCTLFSVDMIIQWFKRNLQSPVLISGLNQSCGSGKLLGTMTSIGHELELGLGPDLVQVPGRGGGANDIVTTLNNGGGDVTDLVNVLQNVGIGLEETLVEEVVALNAGESKCPNILGGLGNLDGVDVELGGRALPGGPGLGTLDALLLVIAGEALVVGSNEVVALVLRNRLDILVPGICCGERNTRQHRVCQWVATDLILNRLDLASLWRTYRGRCWRRLPARRTT